MALPSSGSLSLSQIQSEWGGSSPISLSEYYRGNLPNGRTNYGTIPSSGAIDIGDFYGSNAAVSGWTSTITIGTFTILKNTIYGYLQGTYGALSDTTINTWGNRTIYALTWNGTSTMLQITGVHSNSGWTRIKIHNTNFYRSSGTYGATNTHTSWMWSTTTNPFAATSGTRTITFVI